MDWDVSRVEQKYVLDYLQAERLYGKLRRILRGDEVNGYEPYRVRSLYFDSYGNDDYGDKIDGLLKRRKIRLRTYAPDASAVKLEVKQKVGENQRKRSLTLTRHEAGLLCRGQYGFLEGKENGLAKEVRHAMEQGCYRPKCIVEYTRRALAVPANHIRITFDSGILSSEGNHDLFCPAAALLVPVESKNTVVLEVKYNHFLLNYVKDLLECVDMPQESYSKYVAARKYGLS